MGLQQFLTKLYLERWCCNSAWQEFKVC